MSAKGRAGSKSEPLDVYITPRWTVDVFMRHGPQLPGGNWLEPTAGNGAIIRAANDRRRDLVWDAIEIREECEAELVECADQYAIDDFIEYAHHDWCKRFDVERWEVSMTNPPFTLAEKVIETCWDLSEWVVMLLRLNFLGSTKRASFFRQFGMPDCYVIDPRPSFKDKGNDATEYAWMVWETRRRIGRPATIHRLPHVPKANRRR